MEFELDSDQRMIQESMRRMVERDLARFSRLMTATNRFQKTQC